MDELQELHEQAEHGAHNPKLAPVSLTMAIVAVLVAIAGLLGHRAHTEEVVLQNRANDQWAYYQGKDTRLHLDKKVAELESFAATTDAAKAAQARAANEVEAEEYAKQAKEIQAEARKLEQETMLASRRSDRYDLSEVFLEIALVITSITLLSGRRAYWYAGLAVAAIGIAVGATVLFLR